MTLAACDELGGEQAGEQIDRDCIFDHGEQFLIQKDKLFKVCLETRKLWLQFLVFFIKEEGERFEECVFSIEIVIKRTFRSAGFEDDLFQRRLFIALFIKEFPGGGDDFAFGVARLFLDSLWENPFYKIITGMLLG